MSRAYHSPYPRDFMWGAATAAHQIEGNNTASDWWAREHGRIPNAVAEPSLDAANSYHLYPLDMMLLANAGLDTYRFSIEWARIEPEEGYFSKVQLDHYRRMIDVCQETGLRPFVTLHHFTNPLWFTQSGGWFVPRSVDRFIKYVEAVLPILRQVDYVCTINEPNMVGMWADFARVGPDIGLPEPDPIVVEHLTAAHKEAVNRLRAVGLKAGWAVATQAYQALSGAEMTAAQYGYPREDYFLEMAREDDWVGVQAYTRTVIGNEGPLPVSSSARTTQMGWEFYPEAVADGVRNAWRHARVPIIVTENGIATANDQERIEYTAGALDSLASCLLEGIDVRGYLHWSALDNYEWGSYVPTFGLISWDKETFERSPKPSLAWLGEHAVQSRRAAGGAG